MNISLSIGQADMLYDILTKYSNLKTDIIYQDSKGNLYTTDFEGNRYYDSPEVLEEKLISSIQDELVWSYKMVNSIGRKHLLEP